MRFFVAIGIAGLVLASCGTSAESAATSTSQSTVAAVTPTTTASGVDGERFCEVVAVFDQSDNPFELPQEQARIAIPNKQALMVEAALVAPDEIRTEVKGLVEALVNEHLVSRGTFVEADYAKGKKGPIASGYFELDGGDVVRGSRRGGAQVRPDSNPFPVGGVTRPDYWVFHDDLGERRVIEPGSSRRLPDTDEMASFVPRDLIRGRAVVVVWPFAFWHDVYRLKWVR